MITNITIEKLQIKDIEQVYNYVLQCRELLFPMLNKQPLPLDLKNFKTIYTETPSSVFLVARTEEAELIGTIGMREYDRRFKGLEYKGEYVVEVTRLFVEPAFGRYGLGANLFAALLKEAYHKEIDRMYLHTHPFLPGAQVFWEKQGFGLIRENTEGDFTTLHMDLKL